MKCVLCDQAIANYHPSLHQLKIDDSHSVDICQDCIDKFIRWQGGVIARLFPTSAMKKRFGEKK